MSNKPAPSPLGGRKARKPSHRNLGATLQTPVHLAVNDSVTITNDGPGTGQFVYAMMWDGSYSNPLDDDGTVAAKPKIAFVDRVVAKPVLYAVVPCWMMILLLGTATLLTREPLFGAPAFMGVTGLAIYNMGLTLKLTDKIRMLTVLAKLRGH